MLRTGLKIKAIILQVICTVIILATTGSIYVKRDYVESTRTIGMLLSAFTFDLAFDLDYAFTWPMALPSFARIHFALALGVLGLQLTLNAFFRVYYVRELFFLAVIKTKTHLSAFTYSRACSLARQGLGLDKHGTVMIHQTFVEEKIKAQTNSSGNEGMAESANVAVIIEEAQPQAKDEMAEQLGSKTSMKAILLVYRLLGLVLTVALQVDASVLRFKISRELNILKRKVTRLLDEGGIREESTVFAEGNMKEENEDYHDPPYYARAAKEALLERQRRFGEEHERAKAELEASQQTYSSAKDALEIWKGTDKGSLAKAACEAVEFTTGRVVASGKARGASFPGMVHLSLVDFDVREAISSIGLGSNETMPTSQLMKFFVGHEFPDVKSLFLDGLGDFQQEDFVPFAETMPNVQVLSMKESTTHLKIDALMALKWKFLALDMRKCKNMHGNIQALEKCTELASVNLQNCEEIEGDIKVLSSCPNLIEVYMGSTNVQGTLPGIVIKLISEGNANFKGCRGPFSLSTDFSSINDITKIDLSSLGACLQDDIKVLEACPQLNSVSFSDCGKIKGDIRVLEKIPQLTSVNFSDCFEITGNIQVLENCKQLTSVNFYNCQKIEGSFEAFKAVSALLKLNIAYTGIDCKKALELMPMPWATQIQKLDLSGTNAEGDIQVLENMTQLTSVDFYRCDEITGDIKALEKCTQLTSVNFKFCSKIEGDIAVLASLKQLTSISMSGSSGAYMNITGNIQALEKCTQLTRVSFRRCKTIEGNIQVLEKCTQLRGVGFEGCEKIEGSKSAFKKALPKCEIKIENTKVSL